MGIRIEDSVCVGEEAPLVLSVEAAKEVSIPVKPKSPNGAVLTLIRSSILKPWVRVTPNRYTYRVDNFRRGCG